MQSGLRMEIVVAWIAPSVFTFSSLLIVPCLVACGEMDRRIMHRRTSGGVPSRMDGWTSSRGAL